MTSSEAVPDASSDPRPRAGPGGAGWRIVDAPHPPSLDAPEAWAYHGIAEVERQSAIAELGDADTAARAIDLFVAAKNEQHLRRRRVVAVERSATADGAPEDAPRVVGHGVAYLWVRSNPHLAFLNLAVLPSHRRRGIGSQLAERLRQIVVEEGRTTIIVDVDFAAEPDATDAAAGKVLIPPTGSGSVAADKPGVLLAQKHGLKLELVARRSLLELPLPDGEAERFEAEARAVAGADYRIHTWEDHVPEAWLDQYADLETWLTIDEPNADLELEPDPWDADRVRAYDAEYAEAGKGYVVTAAEHVPSGELVAMTMLLYTKDRPEFSEQETTIVLAEHRGHRLGMLVKAVNLQAHARVRPDTKRIWTWNNENNPQMLAINVALGFRPAGGAASFQGPAAG